jgi:hypothetical protein
MVISSLQVSQGEVILVVRVDQVVLAVIVVHLSACMLELEDIVIGDSGSGVVVVNSS